MDLNTVPCSENGVRVRVLCSVTELFVVRLNEDRCCVRCSVLFVVRCCVRVGGMFGRVLFDVLFVGAWARMFCSAFCSKQWLCSENLGVLGYFLRI